MRVLRLRWCCGRRCWRELGLRRRLDRRSAPRRGRAERPIVPPRHERALLPIRPDRVGAEELVKRQRFGRPLVIGTRPEERRCRLLCIRAEQQRDLPGLAEVLFVRLDVVRREAQRQRRMRVVPPDEVCLLLLELCLDTIPQSRDHVARSVAIDRLVQTQGGVDHQVRDVGLGTLAQVADQESEDSLSRTRWCRHVLVHRRQGGLREEDGEGDSTRSLGALAGRAPEDRPSDGDGLTQRTARTHRPKIMRRVARALENRLTQGWPRGCRPRAPRPRAPRPDGSPHAGGEVRTARRARQPAPASGSRPPRYRPPG